MEPAERYFRSVLEMGTPRTCVAWPGMGSRGELRPELSRASGVTKGLVSRYLRFLVEHGLLQKEGREYSPHDSVHTRAIKLPLNLERIDLSTLSLGSARGLGLYGSWARGTNHQESDLDVWIRADSLPAESVLARLQKDLSHQAEGEVNLLVADARKACEAQERG